MTRFHFEIVDGYTLEDPFGIELTTEKQAREVAEQIARKIAIDVDDASLTDVVVKTEDGKEVYKTPIRPTDS
jgi:NMD protein affecting ribosome stability and mRNA decay